MDNNRNFLGRRVFISGAASYIAFAIAEEFFLRGADLILSDHPDKKEKLFISKSSLDKIGDGIIDILQLDLMCVQDIQRVKQTCDILINCAGNNIFKPLVEINEEDWDNVIDVNIKGTFFLTQRIAKNMIEHRKNGRIVSIGSQHGVVANGLRTPYCISKFGLVGLTKVAALELAQYNILINCVSPTYVLTEKSKDFLLNHSVKMDYLPRIPLHRYARSSDIARTVLFLCDERNEMITGENIMVDGGYTIY